MGLKEVIDYSVAFCVLVLIWSLLSFFVAPNLFGQLFVPSLEPTPLFRALYAVMCKFAEYAVIVILCVFAFLWAVYCIIEMCVPGIFLAMIGWTFTPFSELRDAGIFALFDGVLGPLTGLYSKGDPPTLPQAIIEFIQKGAHFIVMTSGIDDKDKLDDPTQTPERQESYKNTRQVDRTVSDDIQMSIDDRLQQCLEENLINITKDMSIGDVYKAKTQNQSVALKCKLQQIQMSLNTMASRI